MQRTPITNVCVFMIKTDKLFDMFHDWNRIIKWLKCNEEKTIMGIKSMCHKKAFDPKKGVISKPICGKKSRKCFGS